MPDASATGQRCVDRAQTAAPRTFVKKDVPYETGFRNCRSTAKRKSDGRTRSPFEYRIPRLNRNV
jgi:hypothetical protein